MHGIALGSDVMGGANDADRLCADRLCENV